jgi:demethylmenaquinone methyltransferase/2-methoxy-6-polyprenyl-1,4-benzoquinol methylase
MTREPSRTPPPEEVLPTLDLAAHLRDPSIKQRFVTVMFDVIARRYDRFTRLFSFGMDAGWKRQLIAELPPDIDAAVVVDLACGTGDLAAAAAERWPSARVLGFDVSRRMIHHAAQCFAVRDGRVFVGVGDMVHLPLLDRSVDVVTVGYGIRNAPTPGSALDEIARVLPPGGLVLVLDFYRPRQPLWRALFLWYLRVAGNIVGWLWHGAPVAYGYLGPSVAGYLTTDEFEAALEAHGFAVHCSRRKVFGGVALHVAVRRT